MKIILYIIAVILLISCGESKFKPEIGSAIETAEIPVQESWDSKITFTDNGKLKAILYSDYLSVYSNENTTYLDGVKIDFYDSDQVKSSTLTSKKGKVDEITQNMFAIDSVVAVNENGVILTTDELEWLNAEQKIKTDKYVKIIDKEEVIEGYGFESDQNLNNYTIKNIIYITNLK